MGNELKWIGALVGFFLGMMLLAVAFAYGVGMVIDAYGTDIVAGVGASILALFILTVASYESLVRWLDNRREA